MIPFAPGFFGGPKAPGITTPHIVFYVVQGSVSDFFTQTGYNLLDSGNPNNAAYLNTDFTNGYHYWWQWRTSEASPPLGTNPNQPSSYSAHQGSNENVLPAFDKDAQYNIQCYTGGGGNDRNDTLIEFRKADDTPVFALSFVDDVDGSYSTITKYGPSLSNLTTTAAETGGGFQGSAYLEGYFTFDDSTVYFTNTRADIYVNSFSYACDVASIRKIYYKTKYNMSAGSGVYCWLVNAG